MLFITFGCFSFGLFISYIFNKWAQITTLVTGAKAGVIIGLFISLIANFFGAAEAAQVDYEVFAIDILISILMAAAVGAVFGLLNGKMD